MPLARRGRESQDIWPGFVDALATLLMVIIFLLMIFVVAQFYLSDALSGRDRALARMNDQVAELAQLLNLERASNADMKRSLAQLSDQLQSSLRQRDEMQTELSALRGLRNSAESELRATKQELADLQQTVRADKETIEAQLRDLAALRQEIEALNALKAEIEKDLSGKLSSEKEISAAAQAQVALLNQQMRALREQMAALNEALQAAEAKDKTQEVQIANLGQRLNAALAGKVQELARYRSEFFGRLREVLGDRRDIQIVGDRFVFQSEVLFPSGSSELEPAGREQLGRFAATLKEIAGRIPKDINWILRVDGHTDSIPIATARFPSNWELSTARATEVVKFLVSQGIEPDRLAATGFGEFQPLDPGNSPEARSRNRRIEMKLDQR
ncbi:MAG: peptidoglycan -binding protein [Alphaproteobacteria bacterium]